MNKLNRLYVAYLERFPVIFVFLSGFVFFEPSFAEYAFIIALPGLAIRTRWNRMTLIMGALLFVPMVASAIYGYFVFDQLNLRFLAIDAYLFALVLVGRTAVPTETNARAKLLGKVFAAMALASALGMVLGAYVYIAGVNPAGMRVVYANRLYGFFKDTNVFASYTLLPFLYYAQQFFEADRMSKAWRSGLACVGLSIGILLTFSRAAWLVYLIGLSFLVVRTVVRGTKPNRIRALALACILGLGATLLIVVDVKIGTLDLGAIVKSRLGLLDYDTKRFTAQAKAFELFGQSPILGVGPGNYEEFSSLSAHNLYLRYLGERGALGALAAIAFVLLAHMLARRRGRKLELFIVLGIVGILIESFFIDSLHWRHLWLVAVLMIGVDRVQTENARKQD